MAQGIENVCLCRFYINYTLWMEPYLNENVNIVKENSRTVPFRIKNICYLLRSSAFVLLLVLCFLVWYGYRCVRKVLR